MTHGRRSSWPSLASLKPDPSPTSQVHPLSSDANASVSSSASTCSSSHATLKKSRQRRRLKTFDWSALTYELEAILLLRQRANPRRAEVPHTIASYSSAAVSLLPIPRAIRASQVQHVLRSSSAASSSFGSDFAERPRGEDLIALDQWNRLLADDDAWHQNDRASVEALVWNGIPASMRSRVWSRLLRDQFPRPVNEMASYFHSLCALIGVRTIPAQADIDKDVRRTLPTSLLFSSEKGQGQASLRRLLLCYALHRPIVGYCQGLNFIAASLLLVSDCDEVLAFSMFCAIIDARYGYYTRSMAGCLVDTAVMNDLALWHEPELLTLLSSHSLNIATFAAPWFICLFLNSPLELSHAHRIWDLVFTFGDSILFSTGLALLRSHHRRIAAVRSPEALLSLLLSELGCIESFDSLIEYVRSNREADASGTFEAAVSNLREFHRFEVTAMQGRMSAAHAIKLQSTTSFSRSQLQKLWELFIQPDPWRTCLTGACDSLVHFRFAFCAAVFHPSASARFKGRGLIAPRPLASRGAASTKSSSMHSSQKAASDPDCLHEPTSSRLQNLSLTFRLSAQPLSSEDSLFAAAARVSQREDQPPSPFAAPSNTMPISSPSLHAHRDKSSPSALSLNKLVPASFSSYRVSEAHKLHTLSATNLLTATQHDGGSTLQSSLGRTRSDSVCSTSSFSSTNSTMSATSLSLQFSPMRIPASPSSASPRTPPSASPSSLKAFNGNVMSRLFAMLDDLDRGFLDFDQFCTGVAIFKLSNKSARMAAAFAMADVEGKGVLTRESFTEFLGMFHRFYHGERSNEEEVHAFVKLAFEKARHEELDCAEFSSVISLQPDVSHFFHLDELDLDADC